MTALWSEIERRLHCEGQRPALGSAKADSISYDRLRQLSAAIATGSDSDGPVAILANRSFEAYAAVLACFRFGRTFVPLNPSFPIDRLNKVAALSGAVECLFDPRHRKTADDLNLSARAIDLGCDGCDTAPDEPDQSSTVYHLFTSGSTGEPKGVPIAHANLSHYVEHIVETVGIEAHQRASQFFDLSFDLSMHDIFVTLMTGGTIVPASDMDLMMPHRFVEANEIDIWFSVPLLAVAAARGQAAMPVKARLKVAMFCGEALPGSYARSMSDLLKDGGAIWNLYGPTEATIAFTAHRLTTEDFDKGVVPIGAPFGANKVAVLTEEGFAAASEGARGELLLGGPQVFCGYRPEIENHPFAMSHDQEPFYKTGDLVRIANGNIDYIGRQDSQVKIRGHRVELGEIETVCERVEGVDAAAVVVTGDSANPTIVLAFQGNPDANFDGISATLPSYMVPKRIEHFDRLPTNANGKIDRKAIKASL